MTTQTQVFGSVRRRQLSARQHFRQAQRLESIATLAGGLAHDLNNVLAPIITFAELLRGKVAGKDEQKCLDLLVGNAWRGAEIVRQILTFADGVEGDRVKLELADLIQDACRNLREILPAGIVLETDLPADLWPVTGDCAQLRQVLANLGANAREAIAGKGRILIRVQNTVIDPLTARAHPGATAGPHALVTVSDDGCGIPDELFDQIFDPFFTTKGPALGRGLGLSIVHGIVKSHGGFLQIRSEMGRGSDFQVFLPARRRLCLKNNPIADARSRL